MPHAKRQTSHRSRELRRRVIMPARLRSSNGWTDACILNISSRGLMIHSARTGPEGSSVELWRGEHAIVARVIWQDGARSEDRLPVDQILSLNVSAALSLTAADKGPSDRPARERRQTDRRSDGRMIEFAGVVLIACALAASAFDLVERALGRPLALIDAALGG
jgi:hypothetical protein